MSPFNFSSEQSEAIRVDGELRAAACLLRVHLDSVRTSGFSQILKVITVFLKGNRKVCFSDVPSPFLFQKTKTKTNKNIQQKWGRDGVGVGEVAPSLRALTALSEDPCLLRRTHSSPKESES